jgi:sugar lactone lactonase YvrE
VLFKFNDTNGVYGIIISSDDKTLYFVTEYKGLIQLDIETRTPTYLLEGLNGKNFAALNNLCLDEENQIIYVTEATSISMRYSNKEVLFKHRLGRILSYNIKTKEAKVVLEGLAFPNGIVYEKSTSSIIFSELNRHRIVRYYVDGPKKGTQEYIIENLFGYGDNLKLNEKGELLVAIPATRDPLLDGLNEKPEIRKLMIYLPERLIYALAKKRAGGVRIDTKTGKITEYIFAAPTKTFFVTTLLEKNNKQYFGSLHSPTIIVVDKNAQKTTP